MTHFYVAVDEKILNVALDLFEIGFPDHRAAPVGDIYTRLVERSDGLYRHWSVAPVSGYTHNIILTIAFIGQA